MQINISIMAHKFVLKLCMNWCPKDSPLFQPSPICSTLHLWGPSTYLPGPGFLIVIRSRSRWLTMNFLMRFCLFWYSFQLVSKHRQTEQVLVAWTYFWVFNSPLHTCVFFYASTILFLLPHFHCIIWKQTLW